MSAEQRAELIERTKQSDVAGVRQLLDSVDTWTYHTLVTALVEAARTGHLTVATILLDAGADPSGIGGGKHGLLTPLHLAARQRNAEMVELLLARGVKVNVLYTESGEDAPDCDGFIAFYETWAGDKLLVNGDGQVGWYVHDDAAKCRITGSLEAVLPVLFETLMDSYPFVP
jgi:hypothetical protein